MRVQYTLPGYQPTPRGGATEGGLGRQFQSLLFKSAGSVSQSWKQVLRLDQPPPHGSLLPPPPPPASVAVRNATMERNRLQALATKGANHPDAGRMTPENVARVHAMFDQLQSLQSDERTVLRIAQLRAGR